MGLMTKEISQKAQQQFPCGKDMDQMVIARFHDPQGTLAFYVINQNPDDPDSIFGIVHRTQVELGFVSLQELENYQSSFGLGIVRDVFFMPTTARELWEKLNTLN